MILVDWQIRDAVESEWITIEPYDTTLVQPNSYDLTLGDEILFDVQEGVLNPLSDDRAYISANLSGGCLEPHAFGLASTIERIQLPNDIVARVEGKSSLGRDGLDIHATSGWIDAGFGGQITLELYNKNRRAIQLKKGMTIAQIVFIKTKHCAQGYGDKPGAKYQFQEGPTPSRYHMGRFV